MINAYFLVLANVNFFTNYALIFMSMNI